MTASARARVVVVDGRCDVFVFVVVVVDSGCGVIVSRCDVINAFGFDLTVCSECGVVGGRFCIVNFVSIVLFFFLLLLFC